MMSQSKNPYQARVDARNFLNLPGFHEGAYVMAYIEDTSNRGLEFNEYTEEQFNPRPRIFLEIADCDERINLEFEIHSDLQLENSLYKIDTLIDALKEFRSGLRPEYKQYKRRAKEMSKDESRKEAKDE